MTSKFNSVIRDFKARVKKDDAVTEVPKVRIEEDNGVVLLCVKDPENKETIKRVLSMMGVKHNKLKSRQIDNQIAICVEVDIDEFRELQRRN